MTNLWFQRRVLKHCGLIILGWAVVVLTLAYFQSSGKYMTMLRMVSAMRQTDTTVWENVSHIWDNVSHIQAESEVMLPVQPPPLPDMDEHFLGDLVDEADFLPIDLLPMDGKKKRPAYSKNCALKPTIFELKINNIYWQHILTKHGVNFYLYAAYYDNRKLTGTKPVVRLLGMCDQIPPPKTFCQFWYKDADKPSFSPVPSTHHYIWYKAWPNSHNGALQPVLISCQLPGKKPQPPDVVSLVEQICDNASNALRVTNNQAKPSNGTDGVSIAVCVKGLSYLHEDKSFRLVEWLELLRIFGARKVFMYKYGIHPNNSKVLDYYVKEGLVDAKDITLPGDTPNTPHLRALYISKKLIHKRQNELIPYNDCLYRNMYRYDYVVLLDTDEVIVPVMPSISMWQDMINPVSDQQKIKNKTKSKKEKTGKNSNQSPASVCARNVYFFDHLPNEEDDGVGRTFPSYLHMLTHIRRAYNYTRPGDYVKCFHDTKIVLTLHNHYPIKCGFSTAGWCAIRKLGVEVGHLQHYRDGCTVGLEKSCKKTYMNNTILDTALWRFGKELAMRSTKALENMGFIP